MDTIRFSSLAAATLLAALTLSAEPAAGNQKPRVAEIVANDSADEPLPLGVGLRVFIDPVTGAFRAPTPQELASIADDARTSRNKSIEGLVVEYRRDGSKHVDLQGRFMHSLRVTLNEDGSMRFSCTDRDAHPHPQTASPALADR